MTPTDEHPFPSLGGQVVDFIESYLVFGPGDLRGQPVKLDDEKRGLIWRLYEVFPPGHPRAGRRRFRRAAISLRKGSAKTEFAALIAAVELHPNGPVRCDGFDASGVPVGVGVTDPYIPLVAYTEEQSDELAYSALKIILEHSEVADDFDIGLARIMRVGGDGMAVSLAGSPDSRDGARTTFSVMDETHRWTTPRLKMAHRTMLANLPKRFIADAWNLEVTTAPAPGEGSVAEDTMDYARLVKDGVIEDPRLLFFHRQAGDNHDLKTVKGIRAAVLEASGPVAEWSDVDGIVEQWQDPTADRSYLERVWLNRLVRGSQRAFNVTRWNELEDSDYSIPDGSLVTVGFDGARWDDATAIVVTEVVTGFQDLFELWERPTNLETEYWEVPIQDVDHAMSQLFERYQVFRAYCDPPYWETLVAEWTGRFGSQRVIEWWTHRPLQMARAIMAFHTAIASGEVIHSGARDLTRHIGNAVRRDIRRYDEEGRPLWTIYKEQPRSPHKIDAAMAAVLSWTARQDALSAGMGEVQTSAYERRGVVVA